jgi:hypothetical protein
MSISKCNTALRKNGGGEIISVNYGNAFDKIQHPFLTKKKKERKKTLKNMQMKGTYLSIIKAV